MQIEIDVFSDPICPWCYIGKKRLEQAIQARPDLDIEIRWRAFQLNPSMPEFGMDRKTYLENKFGGAPGAAQVYGHIERTGEEVGIQFNFAGIKRTPNTVLAHRLLRYIQTIDPKLAYEIKGMLFTAYFLQGKDIGQEDVLLELAEEVGIFYEAAKAVLESDLFKEEIQEEDRTARRLGISGVPFFIINGQFALSGAQEPTAFEPVFDLAIQASKNKS